MPTFISLIISQLDYDWFLEKEKFFQIEPFYNKFEKKIVTTISNPSYHEASDGSWTVDEDDLILNITLTEYCWNSHFPYNLNSYEDHSIGIPHDANYTAYKISDYIQQYTKNFRNPIAVDQKIKQTIVELTQSVKNLSNPENNPIYEEVLTYILKMTRKLISKNFRNIKREVELIHNSEDKLEFNLSQEKMIALLYLLNRSGVFNTENYSDRRFLKFCAKYFYFHHKGKYKQPKNHITLSNKYGEFVNDENNKNLKLVIDQVQKAITELK